MTKAKSQPQIKMPECERMIAIAPVSQAIGVFLDWCDEQGFYLAHDIEVEDHRGTVPCMVSESRERLLARHFEIDLDKVENERRALLASLPK